MVDVLTLLVVVVDVVLDVLQAHVEYLQCALDRVELRQSEKLDLWRSLAVDVLGWMCPWLDLWRSLAVEVLGWICPWLDLWWSLARRRCPLASSFPHTTSTLSRIYICNNTSTGIAHIIDVKNAFYVFLFLSRFLRFKRFFYFPYVFKKK